MILWRKRAQTFAFVALALGPASLASAQSTNALPDLTTSEAAFDPYRVAGLPDAAKAAVAQAKAKMRNGELLGFVFAASPNQKNWTLNSAPKTMADYVPSDAGRQALEVCEFEAPAALRNSLRQWLPGAAERGGLGAAAGDAVQPAERFRRNRFAVRRPIDARAGGRLSEGARPPRFRADDERPLALARRRQHRAGDRQDDGRLRSRVQAGGVPALCGR
jgi:hypothetical protein